MNAESGGCGNGIEEMNVVWTGAEIEVSVLMHLLSWGLREVEGRIQDVHYGTTYMVVTWIWIPV